MSFRKRIVGDQSYSSDWHPWIDAHRQDLVAIGLPPEVYLDESHWFDFLQNGHLHWHQSSGFEFDQLSQDQLVALHRFLEREYTATERCPLLQWVRVRYGVQ